MKRWVSLLNKKAGDYMLQGVAVIGTVILLASIFLGIVHWKKKQAVKEAVLTETDCVEDRPRRKVPLICCQKRTKDWSEYGMVKLMNSPHR